MFADSEKNRPRLHTGIGMEKTGMGTCGFGSLFVSRDSSKPGLDKTIVKSEPILTNNEAVRWRKKESI